MNCGVKLNNVSLSILLCADVMILTANSEEDLQRMLNRMFEWSRKWCLKVSILKTNVIHFKLSRAWKLSFNFKYGDDTVDTIPSYKYLGVIFDKHLSFKSCSNALVDSGRRAFGAVISKFIIFKDIEYSTFT